MYRIVRYCIRRPEGTLLLHSLARTPLEAVRDFLKVDADQVFLEWGKMRAKEFAVVAVEVKVLGEPMLGLETPKRDNKRVESACVPRVGFYDFDPELQSAKDAKLAKQEGE